MKKFLLPLHFVLFICVVNGQNIEKNVNEAPVVIQQYYGNSGDISSTSPGEIQQNDELIKQVKGLSKQLKQARVNGDAELVRELVKQINELRGTEKASPDFGPQAVQLSESFNSLEKLNTIGITPITPGAIWATATTTQTDGRIWVATTHYSGSDTDTLRLFYSDDGGLTWSYLTGFLFPTSTDLDFRTDDLDIEVMYNGTDWYIYVSGSYDHAGSAWGFVARFKDDGTEFWETNLPKNDENDQYWTRIVSDFPYYTSEAWLYIVATMDSLYASSRKLVSRAFVIPTPYDVTPAVFNQSIFTAGSTGYWWQTSTAGDTSTMKTDVAYYDSVTVDVIVTCSIWQNSDYGNTMYMTYSDDYMQSAPYIANTFSLTYNSRRPIMTFNGGVAQMTGCIMAMRDFNNTSDTDPWYIVTNDGGGTWSQGFVEASTNTTVEADVIGLRGVEGNFKFGWINLTSGNPEFWYRTGYLNGSLNLTAPVMMNGGGIYPDDVFGGRAGYRLTVTDSCFAVFEGGAGNGTNAYGVSGCTGPVVSVEDNIQIPESYSVSQNYPNPFNPVTTINFQISQASVVKIVVYNILGMEVAVLLNEEKDAGEYNVNFNAGNLSSGIYFYTIKAGDFTATKKMVLMK